LRRKADPVRGRLLLRQSEDGTPVAQAVGFGIGADGL